MPTVDAEPIKAPEPGPGWGCSCPGFRLGTPTPANAVRALARAVAVTVTFKERRGDVLYFEAWTDPGHRYQVVFDPDHGGGTCKHCKAAMLAHFSPWGQSLEKGAAELLERAAALEKQVKKLEKEKGKWLTKAK